MKILVCGGAGYIGSHMIKALDAAGYQVVTFDNFSTGHREAVKWGTLAEGDLLRPTDLDSTFRQHKIDAVMHFSARSLVGESVTNPAPYYENNVIGTYNLLESMRKYGVRQFVFSSTAATFGNPVQRLIDESHPQKPINPYGHSKLMVEQLLRDYASAYGLHSVSLRYFNAAGADPGGEIGESHQPETHLIPNVLKSALNNQLELKVFGDDYDTPDGTCVRDYIHVNDLCDAHLLALRYMEDNPGAHAFNLGNGQGFSIFEVIRAARDVVGKQIPYKVAARREGDPAVLVADSTLARQTLEWTPHFTTIDAIIASAWKWHQNAAY
jgi:UDP-glucose 4-epimerase